MDLSIINGGITAFLFFSLIILVTGQGLCPQGKYFDNNSNECVSKCAQNRLIDLLEKQCLDSCQQNQIQGKLNNNRVCICHKEYYQFYNPQSQKGQCINDCPAFISVSGKKCVQQCNSQKGEQDKQSDGQCDCKDGYVKKKYGQGCTIGCPNGQQCHCNQGYIWIAQMESCRIDCSNKLFSTNFRDSVNTCRCKNPQTYIWNSHIQDCELNCGIVQNSNGEIQSSNPQACVCLENYKWNSSQGSCQSTIQVSTIAFVFIILGGLIVSIITLVAIIYISKQFLKGKQSQQDREETNKVQQSQPNYHKEQTRSPTSGQKLGSGRPLQINHVEDI